MLVSAYNVINGERVQVREEVLDHPELGKAFSLEKTDEMHLVELEKAVAKEVTAKSKSK